MKILDRIEELPTPVALRVSEAPCPCKDCHSRALVGWPTPPDAPHHFQWTRAGHALARIRQGPRSTLTMTCRGGARLANTCARQPRITRSSKTKKKSARTLAPKTILSVPPDVFLRWPLCLIWPPTCCFPGPRGCAKILRSYTAIGGVSALLIS